VHGRAQLLAAVVAQLERYLQREAVMPSFRAVVGCAALSALARLAACLHGPPVQRGRCELHCLNLHAPPSAYLCSQVSMAPLKKVQPSQQWACRSWRAWLETPVNMRKVQRNWKMRMRRLDACLRRYRQRAAPAPLRRTAARCALELAAAAGGADACILAAVEALSAEQAPSVRCAELLLLPARPAA
jgi:hypothetical protein